MRLGRLILPLFAELASACIGPAHSVPTRTAEPPMGLVREGTPDEVNIAKSRAEGKTVLVDWQPWSEETFARAKRERKFLLVDGAAAWCHWCHVMDETTYSDPGVAKILGDKFIAVRVDIDERPDIADRYGEWGWPATILLSPDAEEIGKLRGYVAKEYLLPILQGAGDAEVIADDTEKGVHPAIEAMPWVFARTKRDLDGYYDPEKGGWGMRQKAPVGEDAEIAIVLAAKGDAVEGERATASLIASRALLDRVDGGMYQYSAGRDWSEPHYEKLMTVQAANLEAYAGAYALTHDPSFLADARDIERYMETILSAPDGAFYVTQDADVNAHDAKKPFVDGKIYYERDAKGRRELGSPRVDTHVYAFENGIAIAALVRLYEVTHDEAVLTRAKRAADRVLASHVAQDESVKHDPESTREVLYLGDAASLGLALARLAEVSGNAHYREAALRIAKAMDASFATDGAALYAQTKDAHAAGVFAERRAPFPANVLAARFHGALYRVTNDEAEKKRGLAILAAIATPEALDAQGRFLGGFLLAAYELGAATR
jgi:uncharacterized protein YyaL (SSP411 family)